METSFKKWVGFLSSPYRFKKKPTKGWKNIQNLPFGSKLSDSLFLPLSHGESIRNSALGRRIVDICRRDEQLQPRAEG